ncbi:MAG: zinc-dependent metalloprotease, partial [Elusimicrobia bacterium]|nr:zinc-dependent metalloprotease [Elusimicrobiota bacterium]
MTARAALAILLSAALAVPGPAAGGEFARLRLPAGIPVLPSALAGLPSLPASALSAFPGLERPASPGPESLGSLAGLSRAAAGIAVAGRSGGCRAPGAFGATRRTLDALFEGGRRTMSAVPAFAALPLGAVPGPTLSAAAHPDPWLAAGFAAGALLAQPVMTRILRSAKFKPGAASASARVLAALAAGFVAAHAVSALALYSPAAAAAALLLAALAPVYGAWSRQPVRRERGLFDIVAFAGGRRDLEIRKDQLGMPFLLSGAVERGLAEKGLETLSWGGNQVVCFRRAGDFIELVAVDTKYRAEGDAAIQRMLTTAVPAVTLAKARISSRRAGSLFVGLDRMFAADLFDLRSGLESSYGAAYAPDRQLTRVERAKVFARNVELSARLAFDREAEAEDAPESHLPDLRRLSVTMRYSLSALPEPGYRPRKADPRVGFFTTVYEDLRDRASDDPNLEPMVRWIQRWRLEKSDPAAAVSAPKRPIVWWIDPSVPRRWRPAIERAFAELNKAFEGVGFKDALVLKDAAEDGSFDPEDIRYNVIRFVFGSALDYSFANWRIDPWTGEIYRASVNLDARLIRQGADLAFEDIDGRNDNGVGKSCLRGEAAQQAAMTLRLLEERGGFTEEKRRRFIEDYFVCYVLHELLHTLGFRHNHAANSWLPNDQLHRRSDFSASQMGYVPVNMAPAGQPQGDFSMTVLGLADNFTLNYGYKPLKPEEERLAALAARAENEPALRFLTDEDTAAGLDPSAQLWTLGSDVIGFGLDQMALAREFWAILEKDAARGGADARYLYQGWVKGWQTYKRAVGVVAAHVGGLRFTRRLEAGAAAPSYEPVPAHVQRRALDVLGR